MSKAIGNIFREFSRKNKFTELTMHSEKYTKVVNEHAEEMYHCNIDV